MTSLSVPGIEQGRGIGGNGAKIAVSMNSVGQSSTRDKIALALQAGVTRFNHGDFSGSVSVYDACTEHVAQQGIAVRPIEIARQCVKTVTSPARSWVQVFCGFLEDIIDSPRSSKLDPGEVPVQDAAAACWHKVQAILKPRKKTNDPGLALEILRRHLASFINRKCRRAPFHPGLLRDAIIRSRGAYGVSNRSLDCSRAWVLYFCLERIRGGGGQAKSPELLVSGDRIVATKTSKLNGFVAGWRGKIVDVRPRLTVRWDNNTFDTEAEPYDVCKDSKLFKSLRQKQLELTKRRRALNQKRKNQQDSADAKMRVSVLRQVNLQLLEKMQRGY